MRETARQGVLDLGTTRATTFNHELRGDWGFAWQRFIAPTAGEKPAGTAPVPGHWNAVAADGKPPGPDGFATYVLDVRCPAGEQLALSVPAQRTAMHLYVNGQRAAAQGLPGPTPKQANPAIGRRAVLTEPHACPLHIVAHVSNFSHRAGGMVRVPIAGPLELLAPEHQQRLALDTLLIGAYFVLGFSPVVFFLGRRKDTAPLWVGVFGLLQTVYADMTGERLLLQLMGPETPWEVYLRIEYLAWFGSMAIFPLMVHRLFPRSLHDGVVRLVMLACALAMLLVTLTPARIYSHLSWFGVAVGLATGAYVIAALLRLLRQGRADAGVLLAGVACLAVVLAVNLLPQSAGLGQRSITVFGQLAFLMCAPMVLLRRLARLLNAEELRTVEQREKVDLLVRTTQAGIWDWDYTRNLTRYSARLLEIMGWPRDTDTTGWNFFDHVVPDERELMRDLFMNHLRDRAVRNGELRHEAEDFRLLRRDGSFVWVHPEAISLRGADGRVVRYICSILEITEQRVVADSLKQQNAALAENARLREDMERMSRHDLKTPLNSIIGVARLLREDGALQPEQRELLGISERAGYRLLEMINLSLDLSRMELGTYDFRPQAVNLVDVVTRVLQDVATLAQSSRVQVRLERSYPVPVYARAEELLCYSILANLLKNAVEATRAGGTVTIGIDAGERPQVRIHNPARVPAAIVPRFFDKYATAGKSGGTGLGTYSALLMARVKDGELEMSTGEDGTLLTLRLRSLGAEQLPPPKLLDAVLPAAQAVVAGDFPPRRVLVTDDDEYNRLLLLRYLPSPPFTVDTAVNGLAATESMLRNWPDIVLIDMEMPQMNGLATVAWIRQLEARDRKPACLVVMMSSNDDAGSIQRGLEVGSNRYLTKPFTRETLLAVMHELVCGPAAAPAAVDTAPAPLPDPPPAEHAPVRIDRELLSEVPAFLESRRSMVTAMAQALANGEREQLRSVAHRAAGGLALFGFQWAASQSRQISLRATEGDAQELGTEIERLREHLREVRVE